MRSTSRKGTTVPDECVCTSVHMNDVVCYNNVTYRYVKNKRTKLVLGTVDLTGTCTAVPSFL